MDLSAPLRSLIPTLDSAALEVLARTESGLSATQVAALSSRGSRAGLTLVLDRLVEHGLVATDPSSAGRLYRLNREHLLAPVVLQAAAVRRVLFERLADQLASFDPPPVHASVFGSVAHGSSDENSDIDLLLITGTDDLRHHEPWRDSVRALQDAVYSWTGNRLEPLILSMEELHDADAAEERIIAELSERPTIHIVGSAWDTVLAATRDKNLELDQ